MEYVDGPPVEIFYATYKMYWVCFARTRVTIQDRRRCSRLAPPSDKGFVKSTKYKALIKHCTTTPLLRQIASLSQSDTIYHRLPVSLYLTTAHATPSHAKQTQQNFVHQCQPNRFFIMCSRKDSQKPAVFCIVSFSSLSLTAFGGESQANILIPPSISTFTFGRDLMKFNVVSYPRGTTLFFKLCPSVYIE